MSKSCRVYGERVEIRPDAVADFFSDRAKRYDSSRPLAAVIYQDHDPDLAKRRDKFEKEILLPRLELRPDHRVLDLGCGVGRWAEVIAPAVAQYHGTDFCAEFINIACERLAHEPKASFQCIAAPEIRPADLLQPPPFDIIMVIGLMPYLNDEQFFAVFDVIRQCAADRCRVLIREPVGSSQRLTLNDIWSDEMQSSYSAIYRSLDEFREAVGERLGSYGFELTADSKLYPEQLQNRADTHHHFFIVDRK